MVALTDQDAKEIRAVLKEYYDFLNEINKDLRSGTAFEFNQTAMARAVSAMSKL